MTAAVFYHSPDLPWSASPQDQQRFRRILAVATAVALLFSILMPLLPVPETLQDMAPSVPPRYARLLMEHKPPPPPQTVVKPEPRAQPKPAEKKTAPKKQPPKAQKPAPKPRPAVRAKAARTGLLAFSSELAALRKNSAIASVRKQTLRKSAAGKAPKVQRAVITRRATQTSGGIDTARLSRDTGKTRLAGSHQTTRVQSRLAQIEQRPSGGRRGEAGLPRRSDEDIQLVFDRNKGKLYALYNRALRRDSTLQGKVVLQLTISPEGKVSACEIISSELDNPKLERRLVARIKMFDFGAMEVAVTRVTYPIDFFPG
ncbi:MAG: TonB family protein [Gammaproteobacteria bacterium]